MIVFGATCANVENSGNKPGVIFSNVSADGKGRVATRIMSEGGAVYGIVLSRITFSGSVSIELILMTGLTALV